MTREEAIEKVKDMRDYIIREHSPNDVFISHMNEAIEALKEQRPQWIPVTERSPEKSGEYYVSGGDKVWICSFLIISTFNYGWCNNVSNPVVEAWMPIPKPYKKEGEAE